MKKRMLIWVTIATLCMVVYVTFDGFNERNNSKLKIDRFDHPEQQIIV